MLNRLFQCSSRAFESQRGFSAFLVDSLDSIDHESRTAEEVKRRWRSTTLPKLKKKKKKKKKKQVQPFLLERCPLIALTSKWDAVDSMLNRFNFMKRVCFWSSTYLLTYSARCLGLLFFCSFSFPFSRF